MSRVHIGEEREGLRSISFDPPIYVTAQHTTVLVLNAEEYAQLERAITERAEEEAAESGDFECPSCGGPGVHQSCLAELRCDQ